MEPPSLRSAVFYISSSCSCPLITWLTLVPFFLQAVLFAFSYYIPLSFLGTGPLGFFYSYDLSDFRRQDDNLYIMYG